MNHSTLPLCVDLDGTLIRTDLFWESLFLEIKRSPLSLFQLPFWWLKGTAHLKRRLAGSIAISIEELPYHTNLLAYLTEQGRLGRAMYLVTGSDQQLAQKVADHLSLFQGVLASDGRCNLTGDRKSAVLRKQFGEQQYAYVGNSSSDLPVWRSAGEVILVAPSRRLRQSLQKHGRLSQVFEGPPRRWRSLWRALRPSHWTKNLLVFVPWITAHKFGDPQAFGQSLAAFLSFCLCASGTYLCNDLLDVPSDRRHAEKRHRPIASGELSPGRAAFWAAILFLGGLSLGRLATHGFISAIGAYLFIASLYSLYLKDLLMVDVVALGLLYTLRLLAGAQAIHVPLSPWLIAYSLFFFLSLALMKRVMELGAAQRMGQADRRVRGYVPADLPLLESLGTASGYIAVLVFALYVDSEAVRTLYQRPERLWWLCLLLLYWISRAWLLARRGQLDEDPVRFAVTDHPSYAMGILAAIILWISGPR